MILLIVTVFLISNTVTIGITVRKEEIAIMKYIGAKDYFVRGPFIIEGILIGLVGAAIPLAGLYVVYDKAIHYIMTRFSILNNILDFMPVWDVYKRTADRTSARSRNWFYRKFLYDQKAFKGIGEDMKLRRKKIAALFLACALCGGSIMPVSAASISRRRKKESSWKNRRGCGVREELTGYRVKYSHPGSSESEDDMSARKMRLKPAENELVEAKVTENNQYESMKKRIKYMYENGNVEFIEIILSAEDISDFLNKTEYVTKISEYDRDMLVEFQETVKQVQQKEESLQKEYEELSALQTTLSEKRANVETLLSDKNIQIANLETEIGD